MKILYKISLWSTLITFVIIPAQVFALTEYVITGFAWSSQIGWVHFGASHGVSRITDAGLTGYIWNENTGWINLSPTNGGVFNSGGVLSGKSWFGGWGWTNFSGVTVNSSGVFTGTATGDNGLSINFNCSNCNVRTDWRPPSSIGKPSGPTGGSGNPPAQASPILINNDSTHTNNPSVILTLNQGQGTKKMAISDNPDFPNIPQEDYQSTKNWTLESGDGQKTVYAKFYDEGGNASTVVFDTIILDTLSPKIKVTQIKNSYSTKEDVIIGGETESGTQVTLSIGSAQSIFYADQNGKWLITLGKMSAGKYSAGFLPKDTAQNQGGKVTVQFTVDAGIEAREPLLPNILEEFGKLIEPLVPNFLEPGSVGLPQPVIVVPGMAPLALSGSFLYISTKTLGNLILSPLPDDMKLLAQKFEKLKEKLDKAGIKRFGDVLKLKNSRISLPNLTDVVLGEAQINLGQYISYKGIRIEELSEAMMNKLPSDVFFVKGAEGLLDFDVTLSLNKEGKIEQKIKTVSGSPIQLVMKTDESASKVVGHLVFKSKKYSQTSFNLITQNMPSSLISIYSKLMAAINPNAIPGNLAEERLVLSEFEYQKINENIYSTEIITPPVSGQFEIVTIVEYKDKSKESRELKLVMIVDPEGYIYQRSGEFETRIRSATVSLYSFNKNTNRYELWKAKEFKQDNPQKTDVTGTYSFLVPNGFYYLKVQAPGYKTHIGEPFEVKDELGIHTNVEMKPGQLYMIFDWKVILSILVVIGIIYVSYKKINNPPSSRQGETMARQGKI